MTAHIQEVSEFFDAWCAERDGGGKDKYGEYTWMGNDTIGMALEELCDLNNYCRYTFIRLFLMAEKLGNVLTDTNTKPPIGPEAFTPVSET